MAYFEASTTKNSAGTIINPAENEQIILLRRIVKLLETNAVADSAGRQRVAIENNSAGTAPNVTVSSITAALAAGTAVIGSVNIGQWDHRQFIDIARNAYANGIRSKLTFS